MSAFSDGTIETTYYREKVCVVAKLWTKLFLCF